MRLLRLSELAIGQNDRVFRHTRWPALIVWLAAFCGDMAMLLSALAGRWKPGYIFGPTLLLFLLAFLRFVLARFRSSNWLVRANETGLFAQYRSYLNDQLPADQPSVLFISYGEIALARLVRERVLTPSTESSGTRTKFVRYVELELSCDTTPLALALLEERARKPLMRKRWYGGSSTLYLDYPLTISTPQFVRIRWDVVPGASRFLEYLRPYTKIAEAVSLTKAFTQLQSLGRKDQQEQLRDLAARGDTITAAYIAQKLYGCSLAEADRMVQRWVEGK